MKPVFELNAYTPKEIAERVENIGVAKSLISALPLFMLGMLAGAFIGLGAMSFALVKSDPALSFATSQWLGGLVFSLGLILVIIAGAELFTGNNLLVLAWAHKKITTQKLLRNWSIVFIGNTIGAIGMAILLLLAAHPESNQSQVAATYLAIADKKITLPFGVAFFKGILCNVLVCLAVWMAMAGRSVADKILAIIFPITAFVAAGFEHSIANLFFIPMAMLIEQFDPQLAPATAINSAEHIDFADLATNLIPVTMGNIVGGGLFVALVYYVIYLHPAKKTTSTK